MLIIKQTKKVPTKIKGLHLLLIKCIYFIILIVDSLFPVKWKSHAKSRELGKKVERKKKMCDYNGFISLNVSCLTY